MSAPSELTDILERWLQLTQEEGAAIQAATWPVLREIQARKRELQRAFSLAAQHHGAEVSESLRSLSGRLISLLGRNAELLKSRLATARTQQAALENNRRTLGQIHKSYVRPSDRTAWQSFS